MKIRALSCATFVVLTHFFAMPAVSASENHAQATTQACDLALGAGRSKGALLGIAAAMMVFVHGNLFADTPSGYYVLQQQAHRKTTSLAELSYLDVLLHRKNFGSWQLWYFKEGIVAKNDFRKPDHWGTESATNTKELRNRQLAIQTLAEAYKNFCGCEEDPKYARKNFFGPVAIHDDRKAKTFHEWEEAFQKQWKRVYSLIEFSKTIHKSMISTLFRQSTASDRLKFSFFDHLYRAIEQMEELQTRMYKQELINQNRVQVIYNMDRALKPIQDHLQSAEDYAGKTEFTK